MTNDCAIEKRWFVTADIDGKISGVLVEGSGTVPQRNWSRILSAVRELQNRGLGAPTCRVYHWDEHKFKYTPSGISESCDKIHLQ